MKVRELMIPCIARCHVDTPLDEAVLAMRSQGRDALPVLSADGRTTLGMITAHDIALALAMLRRPAHELTIGGALRPVPVVVAPDDGVDQLLECLAHHRVRQVAVVDANGRLEGMVGVEEILRRMPLSRRRGGELAAKDVLEMLRAICAPARAAAPRGVAPEQATTTAEATVVIGESATGADPGRARTIPLPVR